MPSIAGINQGLAQKLLFSAKRRIKVFDELVIEFVDVTVCIEETTVIRHPPDLVIIRRGKGLTHCNRTVSPAGGMAQEHIATMTCAVLVCQCALLLPAAVSPADSLEGCLKVEALLPRPGKGSPFDTTVHRA